MSAALDLQIQLEFVWWELSTGVGPANPRAKSDLEKVRGAGMAAVNLATAVFMNEFEAPKNNRGQANLPRRQQEAREVFRSYG